jgi:hypothetical protein
MTKDAARTVVESVADGLVRHGVAFILGQSVPTALALACEDQPGCHTPFVPYDGTLDRLENERVIRNPMP